MIFSFLFGLIALQSVHGMESAQNVVLDDASQFCVTCYGRRIHKPLFVNPINCNQYYSCFFYNETYASGILNNCPVGTFFNDDIQTCVPEGPVQCTDHCRDDSVGAIGCYGVDGSCSAFYYCSRGISYPFCCPVGTSFNTSSCGCDLDATCADPCVAQGPVSTTVAPPTNLDNIRCVDSFGIVLGVYVNSQGIVVPSFFRQFESDAIDAENYIRACAPGSEFSLEACRCDVAVALANTNNYRQCLLYLPFDSDVADHSIHKLDTNSENVDIDTNDAARGTGAALINNDGLVRVWGSPGIDYGNTLSICLFYHAGGASLSQAGGLFANSKQAGSAEYSFEIAALPNNTVVASFSFVNPANEQTVLITVPNQAQYSQVCIVIADSTITTYVNGAQQNQFASRGRFNIGHCAAYVGKDFGTYGDFEGGHIDEVLLCREALSVTDVQAHYSGQEALQSAGLVPPSNLDVQALGFPVPIIEYINGAAVEMVYERTNGKILDINIAYRPS